MRLTIEAVTWGKNSMLGTDQREHRVEVAHLEGLVQAAYELDVRRLGRFHGLHGLKSPFGSANAHRENDARGVGE